MKDFIKKHEVIVDSEYIPVVESVRKVKDGETCIHKKKVSKIYIYKHTDDGKYERVYFSREMISDIYNEIIRLETETKTLEYDSGLPF